MKRKQWLVAMVLLVALSMVVAGCGGGGGDKKAALFAKGEHIGTYAEADILHAFTHYLDTHF